MANPFDRRAAAGARFALLFINAKQALEPSRIAEGIGKVGDRGAGVPDAVSQNGADLAMERLYFLTGQIGGGLFRMDAGPKQRFAGINVTDARNSGLVEDKIFYRSSGMRENFS